MSCVDPTVVVQDITWLSCIQTSIRAVRVTDPKWINVNKYLAFKDYVITHTQTQSTSWALPIDS